MTRRILAVIAGVITGFALMFIGDATTGKVHESAGQPEGPTAPGYILVLIFVFWLLSAFFGGMVSARINRLQWKQTAATTSAILLGAALLGLAMTPRPVAMWIAALLLFVPVGLLGGYLVKGKSIQASIASAKLQR